MAHHAYTFRYRVRNWHHYNQALIARGGITFWIDEACPFYKFIRIKNLRFLDTARLGEFFDHTGITNESES